MLLRSDISESAQETTSASVALEEQIRTREGANDRGMALNSYYKSSSNL